MLKEEEEKLWRLAKENQLRAEEEAREAVRQKEQPEETAKDKKSAEDWEDLSLLAKVVLKHWPA